MKSISFAVGSLALILASCTSSAHLQVLRPADVVIPSEIEKIAVMDRSRPEKVKFVNFLEGAITGEGIGTDKRSAQQTMKGAVDGISQSPKYEAIGVLDEPLYGTGTRQMAPLLEWSEVERICRENGSQALLVLETFDSNVWRNTDRHSYTRKVDGEEVVVVEFHSTMDVNIHSGWRLYNLSDQTIVDSHVQQWRDGFESTGSSESGAQAGLPSADVGIERTGYHAGREYALRITPTYITVNRTFYTGGSDEMKRAASLAKRKDWLGAAEIWKRIVEGGAEEKLMKRASYNMALACEIEGSLQAAIDWAKKSYDLGNHMALDYIRQLEDRLYMKQRADEQMSKPAAPTDE